MTNTIQNDYNGQISRFDTTVPFLNERLVNFSATEIRHEDPMEIEHARNKRCFKRKEIGHRARFCPQINSRLSPATN